MTAIPFIGRGVSGRSKKVSAQKRTNIYLDVRPEGDKATIVAYGTPGLVAFADLGAWPARGIWRMQSNDMLFVVAYDTLYTINRLGVATALGTLASTTGRVGMADNGFELIIVDGPNGYLYNPGTSAFSTITSPGWPGGETVVFLDSYFIVNKPGTAQFYISGQYDGSAWNALDFATAEANPDNLVAVSTDNGNIALYGAISSELWANTGANAFPFQRISGAALEYGLAARWSLARVGGAPVMLLRNRRGQFTIGALNGYQYSPLSPTDLDYQINQYQSPEDATAFSYFQSGHEWYQITFNAEGVTWLYDATSATWSKLKGYGLTRHRAQLGAAYDNGVVVSDYENGKIYRLDPTAYTDDGQPIERELITPHGFDGSDLNMVICNRLRVDMEGGVGLTGTSLVQGQNPQIMLQISRDGGNTWGNEQWREIGKIGEYAWRAEWTRLGIARDWVFKLRMSDPVKFALLAGYADFEIANK